MIQTLTNNAEKKERYKNDKHKLNSTKYLNTN